PIRQLSPSSWMSFILSSRRRHTSSYGDWSSDVCSSDLQDHARGRDAAERRLDVGRDLGPGHAHDHELAQPRFDLESAVHSTSTSDRKSTRLNSSHRTISYAVFCLKKKKETK